MEYDSKKKKKNAYAPLLPRAISFRSCCNAETFPLSLLELIPAQHLRHHCGLRTIMLVPIVEKERFVVGVRSHAVRIASAMALSVNGLTQQRG